MLRNLINCLSKEINFTLAVIHAGLQNIEDLSPEVKVLAPKKYSLFYRLKWFFSRLNNSHHSDYILSFLRSNPQDIIFLNTYLAVNYVNLKILDGRCTILYVHETETMLVHINKEKLHFILSEVSYIICSSKSVEKYFRTLGRINGIETLYPAVNFGNFYLPIEFRDRRKELGFERNDFIWMMSGALLWNKNPMAFIKAAEIIRRDYSTVKFIWIGATDSHGYEFYLRNYIREKKLEDTIKIIPRLVKDYFQYLNIANGFLLTSFSESFSLAALEAAAFLKPVVSFPCGGVMESVPNNLRKVTANFSVEELVELMKQEINSTKRSPARTDIDKILEKNQSAIALQLKKVFEHVMGQRI